MKPSRRNLANAEARAAKLARGKPIASGYEMKTRDLGPEQLIARDKALAKARRGLVEG